MDRIPPSDGIRQQIEALLHRGFAHLEDALSQLVRLSVQGVAQEPLEQEVADALLASAAMDRLLHHSHILVKDGQSYRAARKVA